MSTLPIAMARAVTADRMRDLAIASALLLWLAYTRIYWVLQAAHLSAPPCPFYYVTGHPCPFCGGTRSFAYMWRGDIADAVRLYPLGPVLFAGTIVTAGSLIGGAITGRTWVPQLSHAQWRGVAVGAVAALLMSWALKWFVLGN
jgi:hypothetical protein